MATSKGQKKVGLKKEISKKSTLQKGTTKKISANIPTTPKKRTLTLISGPKSFTRKKGKLIPPLGKIDPPGVMKRPSSIPKDQWNLPAGFKPDGSFATLAEVVSKPIATFSLEAIPTGDKKQLIVERIRRQHSYPTRFMLGVGEVDKERAITEVEADTPAGKFIEESEQKIIQLMQEQVIKAMANG